MRICQYMKPISLEKFIFICNEGEMFSVALNLQHSIIPITDRYSMISICIPYEDDIERDFDIIRNQIIGNPEMEINIAQMSEKVYVKV